MEESAFSNHARVRMQQRGIGGEAIEQLLAYGCSVHDHHGAELVFFDKAARRRLAEAEGEEALRRLGKALRAYAVIGRDGCVATATGASGVTDLFPAGRGALNQGDRNAD